MKLAGVSINEARLDGSGTWTSIKGIPSPAEANCRVPRADSRTSVILLSSKWPANDGSRCSTRHRYLCLCAAKYVIVPVAVQTKFIVMVPATGSMMGSPTISVTVANPPVTPSNRPVPP